MDLTQRLKIIQTFGATLTSQDAGLYIHHAATTLEFDIKRHLDLDVSLVWDYLQDPKPHSNCSFMPIDRLDKSFAGEAFSELVLHDLGIRMSDAE